MVARRVWFIVVVAIIVLVGGIGLQWAGVVQAVPPAQQAGTVIPYPGHLSGADGGPVANGTYALTLALYANDKDGAALWSEVQEGVEVRGGDFLATLGRVNPIPAEVLKSGDLWLEVSVRGPAEAAFTTLAPRQQLSAAQPGASIEQGASCPHDHFGVMWQGYSAEWAYRLGNLGSGDGIFITTSSTNTMSAALRASSVWGAGGAVAAESYTGTAILGNSISGNGVIGGSHYNDGVQGFSSAAIKSGVYGLHVGDATQVGSGVTGSSYNGDGVQGLASATVKSGVYGLHTGDASHAGYGVTGASYNGFGMLAIGNDSTTSDGWGDLLLQGNYGEIFAEGVVMDLYSNGNVIVDLDNDNNNPTQCFTILSGDDTVLWQTCEATGMLSRGTQASVAETSDYGERTLYSMQSPEVRLEDFGSATLVDGRAVVKIEPVFAQAANLVEYYVFLTPLGDCQGLYVTAKAADSFEVRELGGGTGSVSFDYRIVARRLGYESTRLEQVETGGKP